jgi:hypothetical protein
MVPSLSLHLSSLLPPLLAARGCLLLLLAAFCLVLFMLGARCWVLTWHAMALL